MENITVKDILSFTGGKLVTDSMELLDYEIVDLCIDSRQIKENSLFIPMVGEKVDSHKFIPAVLEKTQVTLTEQEVTCAVSKKAYIVVDSTLSALQSIGKSIREKYKYPVIGVTGSVGKTTTREMITHALMANLSVFHTEGNMNSQIGVPITLSKMKEDYGAAVIEMGISEEGHMDILSDLVKPDIAVVTMIGVAHIEFMKTQQKIREEKLKISSKMDSKGVLFLNGDDALLAAMRGNTSVTTYFFGTADWCDYRAADIVTGNGYVEFTFINKDGRKIPVKLSVMGKHNILNSLAGLAVSDFLKLDIEKAAASFESFSGLRQKVFDHERGFTVIDDTYNASPDSMKASINVLLDVKLKKAGRRIAVLGDMFELGENEAKYHREVGEFIVGKDLDILITIGSLSKEIEAPVKESGIQCYHFLDRDTATDFIKDMLLGGDVILFKASNGMKLGEIVKKL